jgi:uncharacterized protein (TIGR02996 family)
MVDHASFLATILEKPDDDGPRLVYADWLEERGDPHAELIRVQCELARHVEELPVVIAETWESVVERAVTGDEIDAVQVKGTWNDQAWRDPCKADTNVEVQAGGVRWRGFRFANQSESVDGGPVTVTCRSIGTPTQTNLSAMSPMRWGDLWGRMGVLLAKIDDGVWQEIGGWPTNWRVADRCPGATFVWERGFVGSIVESRLDVFHDARVIPFLRNHPCNEITFRDDQIEIRAKLDKPIASNVFSSWQLSVCRNIPEIIANMQIDRVADRDGSSFHQPAFRTGARSLLLSSLSALLAEQYDLARHEHHQRRRPVQPLIRAVLLANNVGLAVNSGVAPVPETD